MMRIVLLGLAALILSGCYCRTCHGTADIYWPKFTEGR